MNEENKKLANVKKSCKGAKIVSKIILVALIIATVSTFVCGIVLIAGRSKWDNTFAEAAEKGAGANVELSLGPVRMGAFENGEFKSTTPMTSDVPAIQNFFDENSDSPSLVVGAYLILVGLVTAIGAIAFSLITSVFDIILKEGNPFSDKAVKRTLIAMIILSVCAASTAGLGFGVLLGFLTWVIYTIMDYGRALKLLSDETL